MKAQLNKRSLYGVSRKVCLCKQNLFLKEIPMSGCQLGFRIKKEKSSRKKKEKRKRKERKEKERKYKTKKYI